MKKLISFISVCCLLYSCEYPNHDLTQDKIPLLKNNDIIYFQDSSTNKIDTFRLEVVNEKILSLEREYFQYINIYYNKLNLKSTFLHLSISSASVDGASIYIDYYNNSWPYTIDFSTKTNFTLHGVTYPIVYIEHDNRDSFPDSTPNKVYGTYKNGIIRYEYKDGRVFDLINK